MTAHAVTELVASLVVLALLAWPLGEGLARLLGESRGPTRLERGLFRLAGVDPSSEMSWSRYAVALLVFNLLGALVVYALQRVQHGLPLNPAGLGPVSPDVAFNTAISFASNTNWQAYGGETTLSHFTQMVALTTQNFLSAATGLAVLLALSRGLTRAQATGLGNFWVDLTRASTRST